MNIAFVYLLLERDKLRSEFVKNVTSKYSQFKIEKAIDWQDDNQIKNIKQKLNDLNINLKTDRDPDLISDIKEKNIKKAKLAIYGSYINLLEKYMNYDYLVVLQDDTYFENDFFESIDNIIKSGYIDENINSARLGQYLSGAIFKKNFYKTFINQLKKYGIVRPLDHCLVGLSPCEQIMKDFLERIVFVQKYKSNISD